MHRASRCVKCTMYNLIWVRMILKVERGEWYKQQTVNSRASQSNRNANAISWMYFTHFSGSFSIENIILKRFYFSRLKLMAIIFSLLHLHSSIKLEIAAITECDKLFLSEFGRCKTRVWRSMLMPMDAQTKIAWKETKRNNKLNCLQLQAATFTIDAFGSMHSDEIKMKILDFFLLVHFILMTLIVVNGSYRQWQQHEIHR